MEKPEKKKAIYKAGEYEYIEGFNQGLSAMETYYEGSELDKMELYGLILNGSIKLLEHLKVEVCIKNSITIATAKAIISARAKKRGE